MCEAGIINQTHTHTHTHMGGKQKTDYSGTGEGMANHVGLTNHVITTFNKSLTLKCCDSLLSMNCSSPVFPESAWRTCSVLMKRSGLSRDLLLNLFTYIMLLNLFTYMLYEHLLSTSS